MSRETDNGRILRLISKSLPISLLVVAVGFFWKPYGMHFLQFSSETPGMGILRALTFCLD